ncbi:enoyl-CoA hydratase-related protein [Flavitalea sp. BT771]|uniref:enoyl-CoA hydratase/isomerase family protein n=1 Tax=Flavitalea sp. BT771 TaxID=3063329 RepID=UPI0026E38246|nr:enoyl-CoA hydratase-related protein [Flavitalea sp. BT771]MDO6433563.1 enoyl-CoA hydratase-related protein [Flavitalea sp. BT771]MDV6222532.1 enoyl-CoA hydratase-related protein [Flavitalea sp. BT771]
MTTYNIQQGYVKTEHHQGLTTIEFFHPQSNSLPGRLLEELTHAVHGAGNDKDTRVIILRSGGEKAFCAGASFDELVAIENAEQGFQFFNGFANLINAMRKCPKFIIARIQGKCVGGAVGVAAAADYAIAVEGADVKLSELAVGIGPFVVGPAVERKIGLAGFSSLSIDATMWRSAEWARRKGLYAELHAGIAEMDEAIHRISNNLLHSNPEAMTMMKEMFWKGTEHWDRLLPERAAISGRLVLSPFTMNAIRQFKKK